MESVRDVMTTEPICLEDSATIRRAAEVMRDEDVGDVLVTSAGELVGILTDRDIVVRALARGVALDRPIAEVCSGGRIVTVSPDDPLDRARDRMRKRAVRRIPVVEDGCPVGIVSLGDVAIERAPRSLLGRISAAPPNRRGAAD